MRLQCERGNNRFWVKRVGIWFLDYGFLLWLPEPLQRGGNRCFRWFSLILQVCQLLEIWKVTLQKDPLKTLSYHILMKHHRKTFHCDWMWISGFWICTIVNGHQTKTAESSNPRVPSPEGSGDPSAQWVEWAAQAPTSSRTFPTTAPSPAGSPRDPCFHCSSRPLFSYFLEFFL